MTTAITSLAQAVSVRADGGRWTGEVHAGWDVFGIPHGGYLAALGANAVLQATGQPDLFTITTHFLRKADHGPMVFAVTPVGGSRRFTTVNAVGTQDGEVVLSIMASVGDRTSIDGPEWTDATPERMDDTELSPPSDDPSLPFTPPAIAARLGLRLALADTGFAMGRTDGTGRIRGRLAAPDGEPADQLLGLIACDVTPPAVWNVLGPGGWVPTVELTAHVRARPADGPLTVDVTTHHVAAGFLEEDALVHDATGTLVIQSRQLARWSAPAS